MIRVVPEVQDGTEDVIYITVSVHEKLKGDTVLREENFSHLFSQLNIANIIYMGSIFIVIVGSDYGALRWYTNFKNRGGQIARGHMIMKFIIELGVFIHMLMLCQDDRVERPVVITVAELKLGNSATVKTNKPGENSASDSNRESVKTEDMTNHAKLSLDCLCTEYDGNTNVK